MRNINFKIQSQQNSLPRENFVAQTFDSRMTRFQTPMHQNSQQSSTNTANTMVQQHLRQHVDLKELFQHIRRIDRLYHAFKTKQSQQDIQKLILQILKYQPRMKLQKYEVITIRCLISYQDLFQSSDKRFILHQAQILEQLFVYYLDFTIIELMGIFSIEAKQATEKILYYIQQNFISLIEIVLYRIDKSQRDNVYHIHIVQLFQNWALQLLEIVATLTAGNNNQIENIDQGQIRQREALRRIKDQNQIIINLFTTKILPAKIKSFTANFYSFIKNIDSITMDSIKNQLQNIQKFCKSKVINFTQKLQMNEMNEHMELDESYDEDYDVGGQESIFDVAALQQTQVDFNQSNPQIFINIIAKKESKVKNMERFLGRLQQEKQGGFLPKLQPDVEQETYTLVLDLDETLIHFASSFELQQSGVFQDEESHLIDGNGKNQMMHQSGDMVLFRPHLHEFLEEVSQYFEIVIFTAALQDYADYILDKIDPNQDLIKYRLYRQHTNFREKDGVYLKDLSRIGRDLKRTIILDNVKENFQLQRENGVFIKTWLNDQEDTVLLDILPLLKQIVIEKVPDVRETLRRYRDSVMRHIQLKKVIHIDNKQLLNNQLNETHMRVTTPGITNNSYQSRFLPSPLSEENI
ncbi:nli interacting factor-like phosphatase family protein [Stylonychia lemnae]|uniref:Nli interacting factor-like phosphatase family protein n=1 Tax=Stylonychia lemnae TaxID=5949 RepID=A0A078AXS1_STYLE|nr:nli interacting factor-like phosphatase family protein [Stylonychia lemnae]|eukprot:CDW87250.1 nli interacting factor-like phosphatase family protein [Stylonychia lemnae]